MALFYSVDFFYSRVRFFVRSRWTVVMLKEIDSVVDFFFWIIFLWVPIKAFAFFFFRILILLFWFLENFFYISHEVSHESISLKSFFDNVFLTTFLGVFFFFWGGGFTPFFPRFRGCFVKHKCFTFVLPPCAISAFLIFCPL